MRDIKKEVISSISGKTIPASEKVNAGGIRKNLFDLIKKDHPEFDENCYLSLSELNQFRRQYISNYLDKEIGDLNELEKTVLSNIHNESSLTEELENKEAENLSFSQKLADKVASFGGSWKFIISFGVFIFIWMIINIVVLATKAFDPYPFILLNLILSCVAALQAPVIMMSQNRQEEKDRERSKKDYMINLKSEIEIRMLHEKLDHLIMHQQQELIEIQQVQIDIMNDILDKLPK